jgi:calmodulin
VDFAEFMKMMSKNGTDTAKEVKEAFTIFNASGRCVTPRWTPF